MKIATKSNFLSSQRLYICSILARRQCLVENSLLEQRLIPRSDIHDSMCSQCVSLSLVYTAPKVLNITNWRLHALHHNPVHSRVTLKFLTVPSNPGCSQSLSTCPSHRRSLVGMYTAQNPESNNSSEGYAYIDFCFFTTFKGKSYLGDGN